MVSASETSKLSDEEIFNLVFLPGFSTKTVSTEVSGRGIGMDVVKATVENLKGTVSLETKKKIGGVLKLQLDYH